MQGIRKQPLLPLGSPQKMDMSCSLHVLLQRAVVCGSILQLQKKGPHVVFQISLWYGPFFFFFSTRWREKKKNESCKNYD